MQRIMLCALASGAAFIVGSPEFAAAVDYRFEPVSIKATAASESDTVLTVRLVTIRTGTSNNAAIIFRSRLDMSPNGMAAMTAKHTPLIEVQPGLYQTTAHLTMAGTWALQLMAKVQGEAETIIGTLNFKVKD